VRLAEVATIISILVLVGILGHWSYNERLAVAESNGVHLIGSTPDGKVEFYQIKDCVAAVGHLHGKTVAIACP
jgi:hypothetical protein